MGVSQVVFGTDIPFAWPVNVDLVVDHPTLSNADKEAILGGTSSSCCGLRADGLAGHARQSSITKRPKEPYGQPQRLLQDRRRRCRRGLRRRARRRRRLPSRRPPARRQVSIAGKRVRVVDIHSHATVPEVDPVVAEHRVREAGRRAAARPRPRRADRQAGDRHPGAQHQRLLVVRGQGPRSRRPDRPRAERGAREVRVAVPGSVRRRWRRARCSSRIWRRSSSRTASSVYGLRAAAIGGHVNGEDLSLPKFDPFWAKAAELGVVVFMHPGGAENIIKTGAFRGRGDLGQHHRQPARDHLFPVAADLRRDARQVPDAEGVRRARRRLPAVVPGPQRGGVRRPQRTRTARTRRSRASTRSRRSSSTR